MKNSSEERFYSASRSEPCLDASGERVKVADALNFVIRKLHAEMIFQSSEKFERLQAVDPEFPVEIVARLKLRARKFEMGGGEIQDFLGCLLDCFHDSSDFTGRCAPLAMEVALR